MIRAAFFQVKILAENKEALQLAMKEILQRLEGGLCQIATSESLFFFAKLIIM